MHNVHSMWRIGAVVLSVGLAGSYVWFRSARAQEQDRPQLMPSSKLGRVRVDPAATTTSSPPRTLLPGSKSMVLTPKAERDGAEASATQPTTGPATRSRVLFYGSKSAPVDLSPALPLNGNVTVPATQPLP